MTKKIIQPYKINNPLICSNTICLKKKNLKTQYCPLERLCPSYTECDKHRMFISLDDYDND